MTVTAIKSKPEQSIRFIPPEQVPDVWPKVKSLLHPAVVRSGGRWTMAHVLSSLVLGHHSLWVVQDQNDIIGAFTAGASNYPAKRFLTIHFLGGTNLSAWYWDMSKAMTEYAKFLRCDGIECNARMGLWKWFQDDGFSHESGFFEKNIHGTSL